MKIDKRSPRHLLILLISVLYLIVGSILLALRVIRVNKRRVVFYGHTFNGNLKALAYHVNKYHPREDIEYFYATINPQYHRSLLAETDLPIKPLSLIRFRDVCKVLTSGVVISDRGAQVLELLHILTPSKVFIDVWHGIPYKGFIPEEFHYLRKYKEIWVSSEAMKRIYRTKFGVTKPKVIATGYSRVDRLIRGDYDLEEIKNRYGIGSQFDNVVLLAPTWQQDDEGRSIIPFGVSEASFFSSIDKLGRDTNTLFIFRAHINVKGADNFKGLKNIKNMPYARYPEAEEFLSIADILVTDWSSIAFDFLVTDRPTIFLDVEAPFKNGFSLGPEHRFGRIVGTLNSLTESLRSFLDNPESYRKEFSQSIEKSKEVAYGATIDGESAERCYARLKYIIEKG